MMHWIIIAGAFLGLTSVIVGAAGDHLLAGNLTPEIAHSFDVALRYHQLYAILIFCIGLYGLNETPSKLYRLACLSFVAGIVIFSGSLYASLWIDLGTLSLGTPVGGMMLMFAWVLTAASVFVRKRQHP